MYPRHCRFLPLTSTTTAVLVILVMVSAMQIQRVHSLGMMHMRQSIAFASAVNCPYTTCSRAAGTAPLAWVSHQSSFYTDRRRRQRRRRQNQGVGSAPGALFASSSSSSSSSFSSATSGTNNNNINKTRIRLVLDTAHDTEELGALLCTLLLAEEEAEEREEHPKDSSPTSSTHTAAGSVIFLQGDLGAGKTCLARGFVRAAVQDWDERVTSPTYLLSNVYQTGQNNLEIHHMDLYRLSGRPQDLMPLNLDHVFSNCVALIEWPERMGDRIPETRLEISMRISKSSDDGNDDDNDNDDDDDLETEDKVRTMTLEPYGAVWEERLQRLLADGYVDDLLDDE